LLTTIEDSLSAALDNPPIPLPEYEPLLFEQHLDDVGKLLEQCLSYRREASELEILSVKAAMDYAHFKATSKLEEEQEQLRLRRDQVGVQRSTQERAAKLFSGTDSLSAGFKAKAHGRAKEATLDEGSID